MAALVLVATPGPEAAQGSRIRQGSDAIRVIQGVVDPMVPEYAVFVDVESVLLLFCFPDGRQVQVDCSCPKWPPSKIRPAHPVASRGDPRYRSPGSVCSSQT